MSGLTLLVLRFGFLLLLWLFILGIVYALRSDLFGQRVRKMQTDAVPSPFSQQQSASARTQQTAPVTSQSAAAAEPTGRELATAQTASRLVITSGAKQGTEIALGNEPLTIGRSGESGLVVREDYISTHHARLLIWNDEWMIQDLDSTNGTFLDGKRVTVPTQVPLNTPIKIGTTSFELRR